MEKYDLEKAQKESDKIRELAKAEKVKRVTAGKEIGEPTSMDYDVAGKLFEIEETLEEVKKKQPSEYKTDNSRQRENLGFSFLENLTYYTIGHSWKSYSLRFRPEEAPDVFKKEYRPDKVDKEISDFYKSKFKNNLVLDLGAGNLAVGYALSDALGAGGYMGVEMNFAKDTNAWCERYKGTTPFVIVQEDMGKVVKDFSNTSKRFKVIIFSGIESTSYTGKTSYKELIKGIHDILDDDGILIHAGNLGWANEDYGQYIKDLFERIEEDGHEKTDCYVYRKKV